MNVSQKYLHISKKRVRNDEKDFVSYSFLRNIKERIDSKDVNQEKRSPMAKIELKKVTPPTKDNEAKIYHLTDETMALRKEKVLAAMQKENIDSIIIYCDLEHGSNFSYLTGFMTRFEESLLVLHQDGTAFFISGNENLKMNQHSRLPATLLHYPQFSLPDQPMKGEKSLTAVLQAAKISNEQQNIGVIGWKMFTSAQEDNRKLFDVPHFILAALEAAAPKSQIENRSDIFIHPAYGVRATNNANEIAYYEFGSSLASDCVLSALDAVNLGKTEMAVASHLVRYGQTPNVMPIAACGERFLNAFISPTDKKIQLGDKMSLTTGFKGGLASRSGYVIHTAKELPKGQENYLSKVAQPYFNAVTTWLEQIEIGMTGGQLYQIIEDVLPQNTYHWHLNPGHLTADEEWMSSPVKENSSVKLTSGMLLQIDIIPAVAGFAGASCENGVALADANLRQELAANYPAVWQRIKTRQEYIRQTLNITLPDHVLPLSSGVAFYTPFFLAKDLAFVKG